MLKINFVDVFRNPVLGAHVGDFGSLLGFLLETILVTFWVPFLHRFLDTLERSKKKGVLGKVGMGTSVLSQQQTSVPSQQQTSVMSQQQTSWEGTKII